MEKKNVGKFSFIFAAHVLSFMSHQVSGTCHFGRAVSIGLVLWASGGLVAHCCPVLHPLHFASHALTFIVFPMLVHF